MRTCVALLASLLTLLPAAPALAGEWLAGDLHAHTTYSHDSFGGAEDDNTGFEEAYTFGHSVSSQFAVAGTRGLDFLAITDHNDVRSQTDPGWPTGGNGTFGVPAYENSLDGHAQMLGATRLIGSGSSAAEVQAAADELRGAPFGGVFQINHPAEGATGTELDWGLDHQVVPDTVEVWNISRLYQPPLPSGSDNDTAIDFWEGFLDAGHRVAATGGSDNHYVATTPIQGVGQPTTWVYAEDRSAAGVLAGLREGHTFVSHQPPNLGGPRLFIEADADRDGSFESIAGDAVPPGSAMRVRVAGAPGATLRLVGTGGAPVGDPVPVTSPDFDHRFELPAGLTWVRAEVASPDGRTEREAACDELVGTQTTYCRNVLGALAMTSAIFVREPDPEPPSDPGAPPPDDPPAPPANGGSGGGESAMPAPAPPPGSPPCTRGTRRSERLKGTADGDCIAGGRGDDRIAGLAGDDRITGGPGDDRVNCGPGEDTVSADDGDRVRGCEHVQPA